MDAFIVDAVRTPRTKGRPGGALSGVTALELAQQTLRGLVQRTGVDPYAIEDVLLGCVTQVGEQGANLAKTAAMLAGLPDRVSAATVNRFCASGLSAVNLAAGLVASGQADVVIAGGVESTSRVPMFSDDGAWFADPEVAAATRFVHMGVAADLVAALSRVTREDADVYALGSHQRALAAEVGGRHSRRIAVTDGAAMVSKDTIPRPTTSLEKLANLGAAFEEAPGVELARARARGAGVELRPIHHVGNGPALADGAAAALVVSARGLQRLGLSPRARIVAASHSSADPVEMLSGNGSAIREVLHRCGWGVEDVHRFEVNESFAGVMVALQRGLSIPNERLNPDGGAIALGHALGATGGMMVSMCLDGMEAGQRAVLSVCGGAGVVATTAIESLGTYPN